MFNFPGAAADSETQDVVTLLLDCHQRIRFFDEVGARRRRAWQR